ncbi:Amidase [Hyella patelloides LEGE 07179]|uniref:Amidase n=1 Tax=Hyella patelloides LEGE 07179 TaxID=945734 RepID=A0A563VXJ5_9CYAN|nr:amidase [Hyella patelloides]VEP16136.1 Amidase [Hyella patelloides LEGE 07179]
MKIILTSASELARMIRQQEISAVEVLEAYLQQIERYNSQINAIVTLDAEKAMQRAKTADEALAKGENWGVLHGVPVTIKDTLATAGLKTTAGYPPLKDYVPSEDATTVARLKAAGAIILGKTNSAELAGDYQTNNPVFGQTNNSWNTDYTVGGSSGGSASAIAASFSALDIGSDIGGSIRQPAHFCGVFGFMPTDRRVPTTGHIPELPGKTKHIRRMLRVGPLARSVKDLQLCFTIITGADSKQPEIPPLALNRPTNKKLTDLKIAWTYGYDFLPVSQDTRSAIKNLVNRLSDAGCQLEECQPPDFDWEEALANYSVCAGYELFISASQWSILQGMWLGVVTEFYARTQTTFKSGTPLTKKGNLTFPPSVAKYNTLLAERDRQISQMEHFLERWDAWICPVAITPAFPHCAPNRFIAVDGVKLPYLLASGGYTMPFNLLGNPVVVIPIGKSQTGLPIGVQIVGKRWQDMNLLAVANEIERVLDSFQSPFVPQLAQ